MSTSGAAVVSELRAALTTAGRNVAPAPAADAGGAKSIAVLPFANVSADPANEFFSDGLTDEIITDLSGLKGLRLVSEFDRIVAKAARRVAEFDA